MNDNILLIFLLWFVFISLLTAIVTVSDKIKAKKEKFRIPEKTLIILALLGGSLAEYFTMRLIRHKTLHKKFMIGLPVIIILQLVTITVLLVNPSFFTDYILH